MANTLPEVRQCTDEMSRFFGAVAVRASLEPFAWRTAHPTHGGSWVADDAAISTWTPMELASLPEEQ